MNEYEYNQEEEKILKIMKMNQDESLSLLNDASMKTIRNSADKTIQDAVSLLKSLGVSEISMNPTSKQDKSTVKASLKSFEELFEEADTKYDTIVFEDLLSAEEFQKAYDDIARINKEFSQRTSIRNKVDLSFLAVAVALQVTKTLVTPTIASKFDYGESFDPSERKPHNDKTIESEHKKANDNYRDKNIEKHGTGQWINFLYQTPPYDTTVGSPDIGVNMEGKYHRLHTLGHDPILGWIFGTLNIMTDIVTLKDMSCYRVQRKPKLKITPNQVSPLNMLVEAKEVALADHMNLPAAVFAQCQHYKSDAYTKCGLPIPFLEVFAPALAGKLYKNQYDALCLARDTKIVGVSAVVSIMINMLISLIHGLYYNPEKESNRDLYEVRTRKILLISNSIASSSSIIYAGITKNPKNLDLGGLLVTVTRLFSDVRFMARIKEEFIQNELDNQLKEELMEIDALLAEYQ